MSTIGQSVSATISVAEVRGADDLSPLSITDKKIWSFATLPRGWYYGAGDAAPAAVVRLAREWLWHISSFGFAETDAFPGADGQIMITGYAGKHCVELTIEVDLTLTLAHQISGKDVFFCVEVCPESVALEITRIVREIERERCDTSGWSTQSLTTNDAGYSESSHSLCQAAEVARPLFMNNVESLVAEAYALTPTNSIRALGEIRRFSNYSMSRSWVPIAA